MNCSNIMEHSDEYLDGMLSPEQMAEFEIHLNECSQCKKHVQELRNMLHIMASMEDDLPDGFHDRLHENLREEIEKSESASKNNPSRKWYRWGAGAAAVIVLLFSIKLVDTLNSRRKDSSNESIPFSRAKGDEDTSPDSIMKAAEAPDMAERSLEPLTPFSIAGDTNISYSSVPAESIQTNEINLYVYDGAGLKETLERIYLFAEPNSIPVIEETDNRVVVGITSEDQRAVLFSELINIGQIEETGIQGQDTVTIHIIAE